MKFQEDDNNNKFVKRAKHRPNQPGVGMRILNEHDADSFEEDDLLIEHDPYAPDSQIDQETIEKYLKN